LFRDQHGSGQSFTMSQAYNDISPRNKKLAIIPNVFTLLNLFIGCGAIIIIMQQGVMVETDENGDAIAQIPEKIYMASVLIACSAVVDFFDGFISRLFKCSSEMGKQLDSLADVVSFGVAPALIIYQFLRLSFAKDINAMDTHTAWLLPAFLLPCAAAYRLARFNLDTTQTSYFKGLPVPAAGLLIASIPMLYWFTNKDTVNALLTNQWFLYGIVLFISYLMVSVIPMMALKFKDYSFRNNQPKYILLIVSVAAIIIFKWVAAPFIFLFYVVLSLLTVKKSS
jgi:CDP-diacylglycerol---serine O-phosphatidyltransferase